MPYNLQVCLQLGSVDHLILLIICLGTKCRLIFDVNIVLAFKSLWLQSQHRRWLHATAKRTADILMTTQRDAHVIRRWNDQKQSAQPGAESGGDFSGGLVIKSPTQAKQGHGSIPSRKWSLYVPRRQAMGHCYWGPRPVRMPVTRGEPLTAKPTPAQRAAPDWAYSRKSMCSKGLYKKEKI